MADDTQSTALPCVYFQFGNCSKEGCAYEHKKITTFQEGILLVSPHTTYDILYFHGTNGIRYRVKRRAFPGEATNGVRLNLPVYFNQISQLWFAMPHYNKHSKNTDIDLQSRKPTYVRANITYKDQDGATLVLKVAQSTSEEVSYYLSQLLAYIIHMECKKSTTVLDVKKCRVNPNTEKTSPACFTRWQERDKKMIGSQESLRAYLRHMLILWEVITEESDASFLDEYVAEACGKMAAVEKVDTDKVEFHDVGSGIEKEHPEEESAAFYWSELEAELKEELGYTGDAFDRLKEESCKSKLRVDYEKDYSKPKTVHFNLPLNESEYTKLKAHCDKLAEGPTMWHPSFCKAVAVQKKADTTASPKKVAVAKKPTNMFSAFGDE